MTLLQSASTAYGRAQFDDNFPAGIENHYWFRARNDALDRAIRQAQRRGWMRPNEAILEVGCGTGIVVAGLRARGHDVRGAELGHPPRRLAPDHMRTGLRADQLDAESRAGTDVLMFLDVIEHVPDDVALLRDTLAAFPHARSVIVTVPAGPELWSSHDRYYGHFRRYTAASLRATFTAAGLQPVLTRSMFRALYLAARMIKASGRDRDPVMAAPRSSGGLHRWLAGCLIAEDRLIGASPLPGLSLLAIGTRAG